MSRGFYALLLREVFHVKNCGALVLVFYSFHYYCCWNWLHFIIFLVRFSQEGDSFLSGNILLHALIPIHGSHSVRSNHCQVWIVANPSPKMRTAITLRFVVKTVDYKTFWKKKIDMSA